MAITVTNLAKVNDLTDGTSITTGSLSPTANTSIIVTCWNQNGSADASSPQPTISNTFSPSLSFTLVDSLNGETNSYDRQTTWWAPTGATPGSGTITFDTGAATQVNWSWIVDQVAGGDNSALIVQSAKNNAASTGLTITLAAFSDVNNSTYGVAGGNNDTGTTTPGSGFTELADITHTDAGWGIRTSEWKVANDTTVDFTFSATVRNEGIAMELKIAPSVSGSIVTVILNQYLMDVGTLS